MYHNLKKGGEHIFRVNVVNYLGMYKDDILNWKGHIDHVIKSVSKHVGTFNRIRGLIPNHYTNTVYHHVYILALALASKFIVLVV